ncbi:MAG: hypothetical protein K2Q14_00845 [Gammaproteobacteria bacterium]|nr:hypothetical protein [Gammaproteobacteria bacterium]
MKAKQSISDVKPDAIEKLIYKVDCLEYQGKQCYYRSCSNSPIMSHTIPRNYLYKLDSDLKNVLTFESAMSAIAKKQMPVIMKQVNQGKFSSFRGFCQEHDCSLFKVIDNYDGEVTQEKIALVHYRNICYGVNHIQTQKLRLSHVSMQQFVETQPAPEEIHKLVKKIQNGGLVNRLNYCLNEHLKRKKKLEHIIQTHSFDEIEYRVLYGSRDDPIFSGRSAYLLHKNHGLFKSPGYSHMPWITYMTLLTKQTNDLVFCWLKGDEFYAKNLNNLLKKEEYKKTIGGLAYACSDAFAVKRETYEKNSSLIAALNNFRVY